VFQATFPFEFKKDPV